ncbi:iron transporter Fth1p [[Candida] railenensis]|uniref:Iron transporter Fth1p n=1 Tax=[Candida] railenensis TaxID=45579 RepID=A0A9P0QUS8_9ASCO|nr:iron transporter Fth1p [[Candida] railenensis]
MLEDYFSIQIFFIIFRETLETAIIVSVLLAFIHQRFAQSPTAGPNAPEYNNDSTSANKVKRSMILQVWFGAILGLVVCFIIGVIFVCTFYFLGRDYWSYTERVWEGVFSLLSSFIITIMGVGLLRINKVMKVKWWKKLGDAYSDGNTGTTLESQPAAALSDEPDTSSTSLLISNDSDIVAPIKKKHGRGGKKFTKKYFLAILPFVTTLREGLEAVVFIGGIGMSSPPSTIPLSIVAGIAFGAVIGYLLYKGGNHLSLQYFLIFSTCFLYMVSAGLTSRGVWFLELEQFVRACGGLDVSETGSGPGSYDIGKSVWHVNCCNGLTDGWWMVFNAIFGWTNSATYGSVGSYCAYWLLVIIWLEVRLHEEREGVLPFIPVKWQLKRIKKRVYLYEARLAKKSGSRLSYERISFEDEERENLLSSN